MRIEISSEPRRGSARSRTDDGLRTERLLVGQIGSGVFAASSDMAFRLRQARDQSDFQLAEERKESEKNLLREQSARDAAVAALADREDLLGSGTKFFFTVPRADGSRPGTALREAMAS